MYTFGQLKSAARFIIFPTGEATNLVKAHDQFFVDALIDLQTWVDCLQVDNTSVIQQCATFYNCGLTVIDAPRGRIKKVSIIDKIDPATCRESTIVDVDWCSEIEYDQIDATNIRSYLMQSARRGHCLAIPLFFGLNPCQCRKGMYPTPTDEGLPPLPPLPLGYHYPQTSTDRTWGRAGAGVWALERGKLYIAPWIQSTESVVIKWDGIKRSWTDLDPIDEDPLLKKALEEYVRWQHADKYDKDEAEAGRAMAAFGEARAMLMHECREETRVRGKEASHARSAPASIIALYYNEAQSASASCPQGTTGQSVVANVQAGTVASNISVADANARAKEQAQAQADATLDCTAVAASYTNDTQTVTLACVGSVGAPTPEGNPVTVTIPAGTISSTSKADANAQAIALANSDAQSKLHCTFWNATVTKVATCPTNPAVTNSATVAQHTHSSTVSQAEADDAAALDAQNQANAALAENGACSDVVHYYNDEQQAFAQGFRECILGHGGVQMINVFVTVTVPHNLFSSVDGQYAANLLAQAQAQVSATAAKNAKLAACQGGTFSYTWPIVP